MRRCERKNATGASGDEESDHISDISTEYISDGDTALKDIRKKEAT
jgi:hypothetical protein